MDVQYLLEEELEFELKLRGVKNPSNLQHEEQIKQLQQLIEKEIKNQNAPSTASHIISDVDHIYQCQAKLNPLFKSIEQALRQGTVEEIKMNRSRLNHYRWRLSLITDSLITANANKSIARIESYLIRADEILRRNTPGDKDILPSDLQELDRIKNNVTTESEVHEGATASAEDEEPQNLQLQIQETQAQLARQQEQLDRIINMLSTANVAGSPNSTRSTQQSMGAVHRQFPTNRASSSPEHQRIRPPPPNVIPGMDHQQGFVDQGMPPNLVNEMFRFFVNQNSQNRGQPASPNQNQFSQRCSQPVHKWPFQYSGSANTIQLGEFLSQVHTYADTEGVDERTLVRSIKHLLKGRALQWYSRTYQSFRTWNDFKTLIKREFLPPNYSEIIKQDLYLRFQGPTETFSNFYRDLLAVFEIVEPPMLETEKLFILKSHLNTDFIPIATASRAETVEDLVTVCRDFEVSRSYSMRNRSNTGARPTSTKNYNFQQPRSSYPSHGQPQPNIRTNFGRQQVNLVTEDIPPQTGDFIPTSVQREIDHLELALHEEDPANTVEEVNALQSQTNWNRSVSGRAQTNNISNNQGIQPNPVACWQCEMAGHTYPNCPNPKTFLFCFTCGKKGCTTRSCESCVSRWRQLTSEVTRMPSGNAGRESSR
ncbi:uncharacterized protein LOC109422600 [Aedes albopictus]|uniref:Retrotransposon gag domain-containing protein n=1 Tax=Aedes albopictus TaxID=7160 RepID=A0ABM1XV05_AEDAL